MVFDSNQTLLSLDVSLRTNKDLIQRNVSEGVKKLVENISSILIMPFSKKTKYLNLKDFKSIEDTRKEIPKIIFHYNHIRIQKNLN